MKLTLSWLKTHLETGAGLDEIVATLTMLGLEVDAVVDRSAALKPFTIAQIIEAGPHPNADKLRVCRVETGEGVLQIVCGAPNARGGIKVVLAHNGDVIPRNGMVLKPTQIRGVDSQGMMCSGYELCLSDDHDGILELDADAPVGANYAHWAGLDDPMLDIKITANRADCLGVRGIARDLAAAGLGTLKPLDVSPVAGRFPCPITVSIEDATATPIFVGRLIRGVKNGPSPRWLQDRLTSIGLRPISALVDITNFMTFDVARPLHVFDAAKVTGNLVVRSARPGESLAALNGKTYELAEGMTAVTDDTGVLGLGGVMGGESTGCSDATSDVFIEAALFDPVRTAATGRRLNLQSDSRYRFERGLDPAFVFDGMEMATRLVLDLCGGEPSSLAVAGVVPSWQRRLSFRPERVASLGGVNLPASTAYSVLERLGCEIEDGSVMPPSFRADIEGEADLVEEVLRIHGYHHIPVTPMPQGPTLPRSALDPTQRRVSFVRRLLAARGIDEAVTFSFAASSVLSLGDGAFFGPIPPSLRIVNPISADLDVMRPSILPNLLVAAKRNADRGAGDPALFEVGPQYKDDTPAGQSLVAAGLRVGQAQRKGWDRPARDVDPFDVKADVLDVLSALGVPLENLQVTADPPGAYHPGRAGAVRLGPKTVLAHFGELHPRLVAAIDLRGPVMAFEIFLDAVSAPKATKQRPPLKLSAFQPLERDFAFIADESVTAEQIIRAARAADKKLIVDVRLFDVYRGVGVPEGRKSVAITVTLQPIEATLTDEQIEAFSRGLVDQVAKLTGATLRG